MRHQQARRHLDIAVVGISAHSIALGFVMLGFPTWTLKAVGWEYTGEVFWPSQSGLFLIILGIAYALAVRHRRMVWMIVGSKASAIVFLLAHAIWLDAPRLVILLGVVDGAMGLAAYLLLRREVALAQDPDAESES